MLISVYKYRSEHESAERVKRRTAGTTQRRHERRKADENAATGREEGAQLKAR